MIYIEDVLGDRRAESNDQADRADVSGKVEGPNAPDREIEGSKMNSKK